MCIFGCHPTSYQQAMGLVFWVMGVLRIISTWLFHLDSEMRRMKFSFQINSLNSIYMFVSEKRNFLSSYGIDLGNSIYPTLVPAPRHHGDISINIVFYNNVFKSFKTYIGYSLYPTKYLGIYYLATQRTFSFLFLREHPTEP